MYHLSVEDIKDMDIQQQEKALAEIQNRLLDNNSSIHSDNPISTDSKKSVLPLSSADQMWLELSSDCSEEEKEKMLKAATFTKNCLQYHLFPFPSDTSERLPARLEQFLDLPSTDFFLYQHNIHITICDILFIKTNYLFKISNITSSADLPHTSNSRFNCQSCSVMKLIQRSFRNQGRSSP